MDSREEGKLLQETKNRERELNVDSVGYFGLSEIAEQLGKIHHSLTSYNVNACDGEMSFHIGLYTPRNSHPVRLVFEGEAMDSIANSLKRIADAFSAPE